MTKLATPIPQIDSPTQEDCLVEWEVLPRKFGGRRNAAWTEYPAITVNRTSVRLNDKFVQTFFARADSTDRVLVLHALAPRPMLGFRLVSDGQPGYNEAYSLQTGGARRKEGPATLNIKSVAKVFPDCIGHGFRAFRSRNGLIVEVELTRENSL
jgi:hypothetical protein